MPGSIKGKNILVTGAARRIGREIVLRLAREGANVAVHYKSSEKDAIALAREIEGLGVKAWIARADFEQNEYDGFIERVAAVTGTLDALVNNASIFTNRSLAGLTLYDLVRNIHVNSWAPFELGRDFKKIMKRGHIINILDSRTSGYDWSHVGYIMGKLVLTEITRMTAVDYAPDVLVNGIAPGLILPPPGKDEEFLKKMDRTVPVKRHGNPEDIAEAVVFLLKNNFLAGAVIHVDGGRHLMDYTHGPHPD